ncbi:MAG: hypothetical protein IH957_09270 [Chloroflexi bacterium]|nr:hypothetical protein [Chloroflexota bacterium]
MRKKLLSGQKIYGLLALFAFFCLAACTIKDSQADLEREVEQDREEIRKAEQEEAKKSIDSKF